tara:strand:+ start:85 stop:531 length:447 start_codon:yes stop_codon:yes gene_type:complete
MANIIPNSFRGALFEANHNFKASGGNTFKFSLYTTNPYSVSSTVALLGTGNGEVNTAGGTNYVVKTLTRLGVVSSTAVASVDFDNVSYTSATFTAAFAAIYNTDTVNGTADRLVVVLDFLGNKTATNGTFTVTFPDPSTASNAIISMS